MSRADRENKERQEKFQCILTGLLRDDDNKYCVDCDAKGPRWASWNLGIFLCIRCAGIHRNLGVHISKVKSVTLDTWTSEQVAMMQDMGNSRARAVYEANIPDSFRRPQSDQALEAFIRAKYEQKKYIASEWVPPKQRSLIVEDSEPAGNHGLGFTAKQAVAKPRVLPPDDTGKDKKVRPRSTVNPSVAPQRPGGASNMPPPVSAEAQLRAEGSQPPNKPQEVAKPLQSTLAPAAAPSAQIDLLGLETPIPSVNNHYGSDDLFTDFLSSGSTGGVTSVNPAPQAGGGSASADLSEVGLFNGVEEKKASTKDAIMALFGPTPAAAPGGAYMNNQQMMNMMAPPASGMIGMVPAGTGMQMVGGMPMQPMMMMGPGMMPMMNMQQQQQYIAQQQNGMPAAGMSGMHANGIPPQQYAMQPQHMYNMQQIQNQMGSMNLAQDPTGGMGGAYMGQGGPAGMGLGCPAAPNMAGGQGWGQHPSMATYPVPAAAPGNVWQ